MKNALVASKRRNVEVCDVIPIYSDMACHLFKLWCSHGTTALGSWDCCAHVAAGAAIAEYTV